MAASPVRKRPHLEGDSADGAGFDPRRAGKRRLVVILEGASLESVKVGKTYELLNCDKHKSLLLRNGRDPGGVRPDITHQLLHKFSVRAADGPQKLLKVIKNPVTDHLPVGCAKIGTSFSAPQVTDMRDLVPTADPIAIIVGAFAHGSPSLNGLQSQDIVPNKLGPYFTNHGRLSQP
ncbi:hypothetical protein E2320_016926 [Naja naja]|nr:hypothetical protein E2320_016926 [Naja naja]